MVWSILAAICFIIGLMMCLYFIYEKFIKKRGRIDNDEVEIEGIEMSPEVIESQEQLNNI